MCEPVTAGIIVGTVVAGSAYQAYSAHQQGKLAKQAAARNALIARQAAADAETRGELEASRVTSAGLRNMARAKANFLAQGQDPGGAGLASLLEGMAINIETDAETVRNNAARQAWGYRNQADTSIFEGEVASQRATQEMFGSILSGVGKSASVIGGLGGAKPDGLATRG